MQYIIKKKQFLPLLGSKLPFHSATDWLTTNVACITHDVFENIKYLNKSFLNDLAIVPCSVQANDLDWAQDPICHQ